MATFLLKKISIPALLSLRHFSNDFICLTQSILRLPPSMEICLRPDFGPNNTRFPPLPEIKDPVIRQQVFTHRSYHARPIHVFEDHPNDLSPDNERLEHLGDTVLGLSVTAMMMERYPGLRVGPSTKIRAMLVGNSTLAEISLKYKLPNRLRLHTSQTVTLRTSPNIQADVFESFVGGLYLDQGFETTKKWLDQLLLPYAQAAYFIVRQQHGLSTLPPSSSLEYYENDGDENENDNENLDKRHETSYGNGNRNKRRIINDSNSSSPVVDGNGNGEHWSSEVSETTESEYNTTIGHLALFNQHLQKSNKLVEWIYSDGKDFVDVSNNKKEEEEKGREKEGEKENINVLPSVSTTLVPQSVIKQSAKWTPVWYVKVLADGELYGYGKGSTKKTARNDAAKQGLLKMGVNVQS